MITYIIKCLEKATKKYTEKGVFLHYTNYCLHKTDSNQHFEVSVLLIFIHLVIIFRLFTGVYHVIEQINDSFRFTVTAQH